jgi:hypothetical protein
MDVAFKNEMELESPQSQSVKYIELKKRRNSQDDEDNLDR